MDRITSCTYKAVFSCELSNATVSFFTAAFESLQGEAALYVTSNFI